jgi:O-antigen ligase
MLKAEAVGLSLGPLRAVPGAFVVLLFLISLFVFSFSSLDLWHPRVNWHDQQRVCQLILLVVASVMLLFVGQARLPPYAFLMLAVVFFLGFFSAVLADWPLWALKEWGRYLGLLILALVVGFVARRSWFGVYVLGLVAGVGFLHAFQFIAYYAIAFLSGIYTLDWDILVTGFSNPRFFGQFQVMLMPILAAVVLFLRNKRPWVSGSFFIALAVQWCIAIMLGGRGLWLGVALSSLMLLILSCRYWRLLAVQACAVLAGILLFKIFFQLIPVWLDIAPAVKDSLRASLSYREEIWLLAWEMAQANPWLGVGPMHYAATYNPIAAHPHQVILQWAAEWGIPAAVLALIVGAWGMLFGLSKLRSEAIDYIGAALWLSILGALVLAQVDGVFVMPYTETWLAILVGLAIARWAGSKPAPIEQKAFLMALALPVIIICVGVLVNEVPTLSEDSDAHRAKHVAGLKPRFWLQGWIPMDGVE